MTPAPNNYNVTNAHPRDLDLTFYDDTHTYIHKGVQLTSVSNVIKAFFQEFDAEAVAQRKAAQMGISPTRLLEQWGAKGALAREVGIFIHDQIERSFLGLPTKESYHFSYEGNEIKHHETISIDQEMKYFADLCQHPILRLHPVYRTEWRIYDEDLRIAGTIDCLLRSPEGKYVMIDWKRSEKIGTEYDGNFIPTTTNPYPYGTGKGILSHMSDTPYTKYILQQNLYAQILRTRYGIEVSEMYLAVLSHVYSSYHLVRVPILESEVEAIFGTRL